MRRRLVITVCPREPGTVLLPLEPGGRRHRFDAPAILAALQALVSARGLEERVTLAGRAARAGATAAAPTSLVDIHVEAAPGRRQDHVAVGWKTYVYSIGRLDCLATIVDESLTTPRTRPDP